MGDGAAEWLVEAAATGTPRIRAKMADAVALAKLHGSGALARVSNDHGFVALIMIVRLVDRWP